MTEVATITEQLPLWSEAVRGMPNLMARSGLFSAGNKADPRLHMRRSPIPALGGVVVTYSGEELRQDDQDVFMQIVHVARLQPLGTDVQFSAYAMLQQLGFGTNGAGYERLRTCLERLKASALTIQTPDGSRGYSGSLIRAFLWQGHDGSAMQRWKILLEPEIVALFPSDGYTRMEWKLRLSLTPMAKWLHSFYSTHAEPYPLKVATLHELMRSRIKMLRQFRYKLRQALELLVERGFLSEARIDPHSDLVYVQRSPRRLSVVG